MMNWKSVDIVWNSVFSEYLPSYQKLEKPFMYGMTTEYKIALQKSGQSISYIGVITKNIDGFTRSSTIVYFSNSKNFVPTIDVKRRRILGVIFGKYSGIKLLSKEVKLLISTLQVELITQNQNQTKITFNSIFDDTASFQKAEELRELLMV